VLTAFGLTPDSCSTVHIYTQTIYRITQLIWEECGLCVVFASYTLTFALQLREKHGETTVIISSPIFISSVKLWWCRFMEISENGNEWRVWVVQMFKFGILTTFKQK